MSPANTPTSRALQLQLCDCKRISSASFLAHFVVLRLRTRRQEEREWDRQLYLAFSLSSCDVIMKWRWWLCSVDGWTTGGVWVDDILLGTSGRWAPVKLITEWFDSHYCTDSSWVWIRPTEIGYSSPSLKEANSHWVTGERGSLSKLNYGRCSLSWVNIRKECFHRSFVPNTVRVFSPAP